MKMTESTKMTKMAKWTVCSLLLILLMGVACGAVASTANASLIAPNTIKVTAPFSGMLLPFDWTVGQTVTAEEMLFAFDTVPVYASQSGKVAAVFASVGDDASGLMSRYGSLAVIEPTQALYVDADTRNAYDDDDNRYIHVGETLYLRCGSEKGEGRVTSVNESRYTVEILSGSFDLGDTVRCFRESAMPNNSETGRGPVRRYTDTHVAASGRVARVCVQPDDVVQVGDLLFEMLDLSCPVQVSTDLTAPVSGALTALYVASGAQVYRGALLCEIADLSTLELCADVDEVDLSRVRIGDMLDYTLDAYGDRVFSGTVTEIRPLGISRQNATYFDVRITVPQNITLLPGMNATVTIND